MKLHEMIAVTKINVHAGIGHWLLVSLVMEHRRRHLGQRTAVRAVGLRKVDLHLLLGIEILARVLI